MVYILFLEFFFLIISRVNF